jgi:hypothetical protein
MSETRKPLYICNHETRWDRFSTTDPEAAFAHVMQTHHTMLFRQEDRRAFVKDRRLSFGRRATDVPS